MNGRHASVDYIKLTRMCG